MVSSHIRIFIYADVRNVDVLHWIMKWSKYHCFRWHKTIIASNKNVIRAIGYLVYNEKYSSIPLAYSLGNAWFSFGYPVSLRMLGMGSTGNESQLCVTRYLPFYLVHSHVNHFPEYVWKPSDEIQRGSASLVKYNCIYLFRDLTTTP